MERVLRRKLKKGFFKGVSPLRSKIMGAIRGKHNKSTEAKLRMALIKAGLKGWVLHPIGVFGKPDVFFPKEKLAVFVDGCFWHCCPECGHVPKTRSAFWKMKFERNQVRAKVVKAKLRQNAIKVMRIWEHAFESPSQINRVVKTIKKHLLSGKTSD